MTNGIYGGGAGLACAIRSPYFEPALARGLKFHSYELLRSRWEWEHGREKILPLVKGSEELMVLRIVPDSGILGGRIGILDRVDTDAEFSPQQNLDGLRNLVRTRGDEAAEAH